MVSSKRSTMTLYSSPDDPYSHRVRIVLAEKVVNVDILDVKSSLSLQQELQELNPYNTIPTLVDRDLILFRSEIIMEYLEERFPHPPLLPIYPISKARSRLMIYRINRDWYTHLDVLLAAQATAEQKEQAKINLIDSISSVVSLFIEKPFFGSDDFSLLDCCVAPLLWRLFKIDDNAFSNLTAIRDYAKKIFARASFKESLVEHERFIRV